MNSINLRFTCGIVREGSIYASCRNFNGLYKISLLTKKVDFLSYFEGEEISAVDLHRDVFLYHTLLCFVPSKAESIHIYDLEKGKMDKINFRAKQDKGGFVGHLVDEILWLIPVSVGENLYRVNILTKEVMECLWDDVLAPMSIDMQSSFFVTRTTLQKKKIFLPVVATNTVLELDVDTGDVAAHELALKKLWGCYPGENGLWILADNGSSIYLWNYEKNELKLVVQNRQGDNNKRIWNWVVEHKGNVYVVPQWGRKLCMIEGDSLIDLIEIDEAAWQISSDGAPFFLPIIDGDSFILLPYGSKILLTIKDKEVLAEEGMVLTEDMSSFSDYLLVSCRNPGKEGERLDLETFISGVVQSYKPRD